MIIRKLDKSSATPLYLQLARILEEAIANDYYKKGAKLPPEQELTQTYNISRVTVRQAMDYLLTKDIVVRKQGIGTFVKKDMVKTTVDEVVGFYPALLRHGIKPITKTVEYREITPNQYVRERLKLTDAEKVLLHVRQYFINETPLLLAEIYIPNSLAAKWTRAEADGKNSLQLVKEKTGLQISHSEVTIRSTSARESVAKCLNVRQGSPILELRRVTYSTENYPVEYCIHHFRGDSYELTTTISVTEQNKLVVNTSPVANP